MITYRIHDPNECYLADDGTRTPKIFEGSAKTLPAAKRKARHEADSACINLANVSISYFKEGELLATDHAGYGRNAFGLACWKCCE